MFWPTLAKYKVIQFGANVDSSSWVSLVPLLGDVFCGCAEHKGTQLRQVCRSILWVCRIGGKIF